MTSHPYEPFLSGTCEHCGGILEEGEIRLRSRPDGRIWHAPTSAEPNPCFDAGMDLLIDEGKVS